MIPCFFQGLNKYFEPNLAKEIELNYNFVLSYIKLAFIIFKFGWGLYANSSVFKFDTDVLFISTLTDYFCGLGIQKNKEKFKKKQFVFLSLFINLTLLGIFKYYDFFAESFKNLMENFGMETHPYFLNIASRRDV